MLTEEMTEAIEWLRSPEGTRWSHLLHRRIGSAIPGDRTNFYGKGVFAEIKEDADVICSDYWRYEPAKALFGYPFTSIPPERA